MNHNNFIKTKFSLRILSEERISNEDLIYQFLSNLVEMLDCMKHLYVEILFDGWVSTKAKVLLKSEIRICGF